MQILLPTASKTSKYVLEASDRPDLGPDQITGNTGTVIGKWIPTTGRAVRIPRPCWADRRAVHGRFLVQESAGADWTVYLIAHVTV